MMSNVQMDRFFKKKTVVCFFLSILVCLIHVHSFDGYTYTGTLGHFLTFFKDIVLTGFTGVAIRLFFVISGVLFYRNYTLKKTLEKYKSRVKSLLIPYLCWCTIYTVVILAIGKTPMGSWIAIDSTFSVANVFQGIFLNYYYKSFWFVFDLIIFTMLCPGFYFCLKNKIIGLFTIVLITLLYCFNIRIPETVMLGNTEYVLFWRADSIIFYLIGAYIGIHCFDYVTREHSRRIAWGGVLVYVLLSVSPTLSAELGFAENDIQFFFRMLVSCAAVWVMFDLYDYHKPVVEMCNYSFMAFALNFYLGVYISKVCAIILPKQQIFSLVNLLITICFEISIIFGVSHLLNHRCKKVYGVLAGGR